MDYNNKTNKTIVYKLSEKLISLWKDSYSSTIFCHNDVVKSKNSVILSFAKKIPIQKYFSKPIKAFFSRAVDNSFFAGKIIAFYEYLLSVSLKCYGWCALTFIAISLFFNALNYTFTEQIALNSIIASISILPTLFYSKSISSVICESGLLSYLFLKLLDCERLIFFSKNKSKGSVSGAIIVGFVLSFFTLAYSRQEIIVFIILLILTAVFMCRPETAVLSIALIFPFLPYSATIYLVFISLISYFVKVLRGKRSIYFNSYDFVPLGFVLLYSFLTVAGKTSFVAILFPLIYYLFSGIVRNESLMIKCVKNITISVTIYAFCNLIIYFFKNVLALDFRFLCNLVKGTYTFSESEAFTVFYAIAFILLLSMTFYGKIKRRFCFFGLVINALAMYLSDGRYTIIACVFSVAFLFINVLKNKIVVLFFTSALGVVTYRIFSLHSDMLKELENALELIKKYFRYLIFGVDNSNMIFEAEGISNSGSLILDLAFWGGIITVIYVYASMFVFVRNGISSYDTSNLKTKPISITVSCAVVLYIVASFGCFVWEDYRIFGLIWILGGISSASRRNMQNENTEIALEQMERFGDGE